MNKAETRAEHIVPALKAAGWGVADLGRPEEIAQVFTRFQKCLYQQQAAA